MLLMAKVVNAGRVVALQQFRESHIETGPCLLGVAALLAQSHSDYATQPYGYRSVSMLPHTSRC